MCLAKLSEVKFETVDKYYCIVSKKMDGIYNSLHQDGEYRIGCWYIADRGLVPSFDGIYWRLHGKDGKIIRFCRFLHTEM